MNRNWIVIAEIENLTAIAPLNRIWYAESNSPNEKMRLSGDPDVLEVIKIFLKALPPTYTKKDAKNLMEKAINDVFLWKIKRILLMDGFEHDKRNKIKMPFMWGVHNWNSAIIWTVKFWLN